MDAAVPDERAALEAEIARLQGENVALKKDHRAQSAAAGHGQGGADAAEAGGAGAQLPNDADLNKVMNFMEKAWRRPVEMIVTLQKDILNKT
jgi:hypothetical protein